jgi:Ni/Co efflux regulator RcnB
MGHQMIKKEVVMNTQPKRLAPWGLLIGVALMVAQPVWAAKPEWAEGQGQGQGKSKAQDPSTREKDRSQAPASAQISGSVQIGLPGVNVNIRFGDDQRRAVQSYFAPRVAAGNCPPGLAKKNNGCLPPGQAKQWQRGAPLPSGVVVYPLPRELEIRLGVPPAGHKYVRVAADILLIAVGTSMVIDAIEDLAGL